MGKRKAADANDEELEAEFSASDSERPLKQKKTIKVDTLEDLPKHRRKSKGASDSEEERPIKKKAEKPSRYKEASLEESEEESGVVVKTNNDGNRYIDLGRKRRATVYIFKGKPLLDIREYYGPEGDENPGKKGISVSQDEWETLKRNASTIDVLFKKLSK
ncbi:PC4-domain-containing protein [Daedalea quercina L-15889]|uniref:PC4-domain-containing protein n=1 Tax=Daedalea quercina L-15889 TaxID=1314783 RepID=A0A165SKQ3_9APHY|nr:PC4-domain-containing protein [Daedalea quercina L-15889]